MRSLYFAALVILLQCSSAFSQQPSPIDFRVMENNRLFLGDDADRYSEDLHTYLWCVNSENENRTDECNKYIDDGKRHSEIVPNLRREDPKGPYSLRYHPHTHAYPTDYVLNGRRELTFFLDRKRLKTSLLGSITCKWTIDRTELKTTDCDKAMHTVTLVASEDGSKFSYSGTASVEISVEGGPTETFQRSFVTHDLLLIAMGDSFVAGEGNPSHNKTNTAPAEWMDYRCHRSVFSYPTIVATALALLDKRHSITLVHVACSGAETTAGLRFPYVGAVDANGVDAYRQALALREPAEVQSYRKEFERLPAQIDQVSRLLRSTPDGEKKRNPNLVMMSVGVNDWGISEYVNTMAANWFFKAEPGNRDQSCPSTDKAGDRSGRFETPHKTRLRLSESCLEERLRRVGEDIGSKIKPQETFLVSYIDPVTNGDGKACGEDDRITLLDGYTDVMKMSGEWEWLKGVGGDIVGLPHLSHDEMKRAKKDFVLPLLKTMGDEKTHGWTWVPYNEDNDEGRKGFCARPSWYHTYRASYLRQGVDPGSNFIAAGTLHPNTFGQYFAAVRVMAKLRKQKQRVLADHNIHALTIPDFEGPAAGRNKINRGFAWHIWDWGRNPQNLERYQKHKGTGIVE